MYIFSSNSHKEQTNLGPKVNVDFTNLTLCYVKSLRLLLNVATLLFYACYAKFSIILRLIQYVVTAITLL